MKHAQNWEILQDCLLMRILHFIIRTCLLAGIISKEFTYLIKVSKVEAESKCSESYQLTHKINVLSMIDSALNFQAVRGDWYIN